MGLFGWFADKVKESVDFVKDTVREVGEGVNVVKDTVRKVGELVKEVGETVAEIGEAIVDGAKELLGFGEKTAAKIDTKAQETSTTIGSTKSYDSQKASINETKKLNDELGKFKNLAFKASDEFETMLVKLGKNIIAKLAKPLSEREKEDFTSQCSRILEQIKGVIKREISSKISLGDNGVLSILKLESGDEKSKRMRNFINSTTKIAFKALGKDFAKNIEGNVESITKSLQNQLDFQQTLIKQQLEMLTRLKETNGVDEKQREQTKLGLDLSKQMAVLRALKGGA